VAAHQIRADTRTLDSVCIVYYMVYLVLLA
jgi:hypothetical protein